jgi:hypothetical protein
MPRIVACLAVLLVLPLLFGLRLRAAPEEKPAPSAGLWNATGTLLESCTCAVPCTCNFGEGPSPHPYCHAVFAYRLEEGAWGETDLSGLIFGGADGPKGNLGFVDERATPAQRASLEHLARAVFARGGPAPGPRAFVPARITHTARGNTLRLDIAGRGGFTAHVLIGGDRKTPIVVENNATWPIRRAIKAKALLLRYRDERGNAIEGSGANANYGAFSFTGRIADTAVARVSARTRETTSCCGAD